jgi:hypothetical protein
MHRALWLLSLLFSISLLLSGCSSSDNKDKSPIGPQDENEMVDETPEEEENNSEIQLEGAFIAVMTINGVNTQVSCTAGGRYGQAGNNTVTFNTLNHSDSCSGDSGTFFSILNFPAVTAEGFSSGADVIVQAQSVRNLVLATASGGQAKFTVESWDAATKYIKARLDVSWENGDSIVALFDMNLN